MDLLDDSYTLTLLAGILLGWLACLISRRNRR